MRTVGQVLKEARLERMLDLDDIEKHTKIRKELLEALEADNYEKLPPSTFVQGFIKNYGNFLHLDSQKLLAIFRRDFESKKHPPQVMDSFSKPLQNKKIQITPSHVLVTAIAIIIIGFFSYLWLEYRQFVSAPMLQVLTPKDQQTVDIPTVIVEGKTDPEAKVTVNETEIAVDKEGNFKEDVKLSSTTNTLVISSTSKFNQTAKEERTVFVKK